MKIRTQMFRLNGVKMNLSLSKTRLKTLSAVFLFSIDFFIYIRYRKCNAGFNKLINTVSHRARF